MSPSPHSSLLAPGLEATLRDDNPWWRGERVFGLPVMRRWPFDVVASGLRDGLTPVTVLRGPRQAHYNARFGVLVTMLDEPGTDDPRIVSIPLSTLLLMR